MFFSVDRCMGIIDALCGWKHRIEPSFPAVCLVTIDRLKSGAGVK
jgi:hypothetical protein